MRMAKSETITAKFAIDPVLGKVERVFALQENSYWNADAFLTPVILATLRQFRRSKRVGLPVQYLPKWHLKHPERELSKRQWRKARRRWGRDLDRAIAAFELLANFDAEWRPENQEEIKRGLRVFARIYRSLWD